MKTLREQVDAGDIKIPLSDEDIDFWEKIQSCNAFKAEFNLDLLNQYKRHRAFILDTEQKLWETRKEYPLTPNEAYVGRTETDVDFTEKVKEISKYYNSVPIMEIENTFRSKDPTNLFIETKKRKVTTINNKTITYTHCIPSSINLVKFTWKQRLKILLGIKVNVIINTYLNAGRIELTILKIEE